MKVYIAAPFFNEQQLKTVEQIKLLLTDLGINYFSPKDECMFIKGETKPEDILKMNLDNIEECTCMIAVTEGKDMGTLFECGYAHAKGQDIIYFWQNIDPSLKFNLMLSASSYVVARTYKDLEKALCMIDMGLAGEQFVGELE